MCFSKLLQRFMVLTCYDDVNSKSLFQICSNYPMETCCSGVPRIRVETQRDEVSGSKTIRTSEVLVY